MTELSEEAARELRALIGRLTFVFAKTMPESPHEYTARRNAADPADYVALFAAIQAHGVRERWNGRRYRYLYLDGWRYWTMTSALGQSWIINRARVT